MVNVPKVKDDLSAEDHTCWSAISVFEHIFHSNHMPIELKFNMELPLYEKM